MYGFSAENRPSKGRLKAISLFVRLDVVTYYDAPVSYDSSNLLYPSSTDQYCSAALSSNDSFILALSIKIPDSMTPETLKITLDANMKLSFELKAAEQY